MFHVKLSFFIALIIPVTCFTQHLGTTILPAKAIPTRSLDNTQILVFLDSSAEYKALDSVKKQWFYWTNFSRSSPRRFWDSVVFPMMESFPTLKSSYTNSLRVDLYKTPPLPYIKPNSKLLEVAQSFANEMASKSASPSHTSPSGLTFVKRMKSAGIVKCAGENLSYGPLNPLLMLILLYVDEGVSGLGHRKALLNPAFVEMGIGISLYKNNNSIVIQDFACDQKQ